MEYNTQTAEHLRDQFGFAGIQVLLDFITADEEANLLHCLDQVDMRLPFVSFSLGKLQQLAYCEINFDQCKP